MCFMKVVWIGGCFGGERAPCAEVRFEIYLGTHVHAPWGNVSFPLSILAWPRQR